MTRITRSDAIVAATAMNLPDALMPVVRGGRATGHLSTLFGSAEPFYTGSGSHSPFPEQQVFPFWDDGSFYNVVAGDLRAGKFVQFCVEEEFDLRSLPRLTLEQVLLDTFIFLWESRIPEGDFRELARALRFPAADEIIEAYRVENFSTPAPHTEWRDGLFRRLAR